MAKLVVLSEGLTGLSFELLAEKSTIGRLEDNAFVIQEGSVSSHHCEIVRRGNEFLVRDLSSTNGSFINGEKVTESVLRPGQILRLGQVEIRLETGADAPPKKKLDHTLAIGVNLNDLEQGTKGGVAGKNLPFAKKSNKTNLVFIAVGAVLILCIIVFVIIAFMKMGDQ